MADVVDLDSKLPDASEIPDGYSLSSIDEGFALKKNPDFDESKVSDPADSGQQIYEETGYVANDGTSFGTGESGSLSIGEQTTWPNSGYLGISQEVMPFNGDEMGLAYAPQGYEMGFAEGTLPQPTLENDQLLHGMNLSMDPNMVAHEPPRRLLSKGRKNKDEANELVRRAKLLPKVMGVRYDANHQYWVATWYQNRKRMDRYFSVGRFGFEEARLLAIDCRKTAGKSLQGKSYDRPNYGKEAKRAGYGDSEEGLSKRDYYASGVDIAKKSKDFNRLNVSKVALNYILSDLCNNCLPTILENNHMPGELYIHCYNKISDHLQMIITANQSEEIEKYLHLFQLCIQNRVLPSVLQVQEQRAMITTLCQM